MIEHAQRCGLGIGLLIILAGCSPRSTSLPSLSHTTASGEQGAALSGYLQRVNQIGQFTFEGFAAQGVPLSQVATVPPVWTGEKIRGEQSEAKLGEGALFLFTSAQDETLIMVEIAHVPGLTGTGILRTAWFDAEVAAKASACSGCTYQSVVQFYEPEFLYTVTAMAPNGPERWLYRFTEALMHHLRG